MKIAVEILEPTRVAVTRTPSLEQRALFKLKTETRYAVRGPARHGGFAWTWDDDGKLVDARSRHMIEHALQVAPAVSAPA